MRNSRNDGRERTYVRSGGGVTLDGSADWSVQQGASVASVESVESSIKDIMPAGTVIAYAANTLPDGWLTCDGAAVSRTTYARLFSVIGTTYGKGDGSTTFCLPNLVDKFVQGSNTAGTGKEAGLPNITGMPGAILLTPPITLTKGAFKYDVNTLNASGESGVTYSSRSSTKNYMPLLFDASFSNSTYGASNTVQPPALTMRYIIKF